MNLFLYVFVALGWISQTQASEKPLFLKVPAETAEQSVGTAIATLSAETNLKITAVEVDANNNEVQGGLKAEARPQSWASIRGQIGMEAGTTGPFAVSLGARALKGTLQASGEWTPMETYGYTVTLDPVSAFRQNWIARPIASYKYFKLFGARFDRAPEDGEREFKETKGFLYGVRSRPLWNGSMEIYAQGGRGDVQRSVWNLPQGYYKWIEEDRANGGQVATTKKDAVIVIGVSFFLGR